MSGISISQSVGNTTLNHADTAVRLAQKWQGAAEDWERVVKEHGPKSKEAEKAASKARRAADKASDSLVPLIHLESPSGHVDQDDWDDLRAENSRVADALVKLRLAAIKGQKVVHPAYAKDTKHAPRSWVGCLDKAARTLQKAIESPRQKHRRKSTNESRDEFVYDEYVKGIDTDQIIKAIKANSSWEPLNSAPAIRRAVLRFAERRGYPRPTRGQGTNHRLERG
jgi:hypothetical protein